MLLWIEGPYHVFLVIGHIHIVIECQSYKIVGAYTFLCFLSISGACFSYGKKKKRTINDKWKGKGRKNENTKYAIPTAK